MRCLLSVVALLPFAGCSGETPAPVEPSGGPPPLFREITVEAGLDFSHDPGIDDSFYMPEIMGAGGALLDYDNDGDLDVYVIDSGPHDPERFGRSTTTNRLYRYEENGTLTDVTEGSSLGDPGYGMGCAVGDIDNDGDADVYVTNFGPDALYRKQMATAPSPTSPAGAASRARSGSTSAAFFDYDLDGFLDLYVAHYVHYDPPKSCRHTTGREDYCGPDNFPGVADVLYRNDGDGTFTDVTARTGMAATAGKGLGVYPIDFDADGFEDIYVANDGVENHLWMNKGDGSFEERALMLGAAVNIQGQSEASMGVAVGDIDGDLDFDLFMTHLDRETNTLYVNEQGKWFEDLTDAMGLADPSRAFNGFGAEFFDYDHDGDLDLAIVNGQVRLGPEALADADLSFLGDFAESNLLFANDGNGRFTETSELAGSLCSEVEVSRSLAPGDLDGDGDLDLLLTNCNGPARLFLNEVPDKGHWLIVRAIDPALNRDAIGALIEVEAGSTRQLRHVTRTASYLASRDPAAHFGLGVADRVEEVRVRWPGGGWESFPGGPADRSIVLTRGEGTEVAP